MHMQNKNRKGLICKWYMTSTTSTSAFTRFGTSAHPFLRMPWTIREHFLLIHWERANSQLGSHWGSLHPIRYKPSAMYAEDAPFSVRVGSILTATPADITLAVWQIPDGESPAGLDERCRLLRVLKHTHVWRCSSNQVENQPLFKVWN